jgi:hypothetical protein
MKFVLPAGGPKPEPEPRRRSPAWFWWILVNVTAACFAILAWVGCLFVFTHPEKPENYRWLKKIGRTPKLHEFTALDVPAGTAADPRSLYRKFLPLSDAELAMLNPRLLRNYLTNFEQPLLNTYVEGEYRVQQVRPLATGDLFHPGFAVRARAEVRNKENERAAPYPVWIDYLFPCEPGEAIRWFSTGDVMLIEKVPNCAVVLRADRFVHANEPQLLLTVIPIAYGDYSVGADRSFAIAPPGEINPSARLPVFLSPED